MSEKKNKLSSSIDDKAVRRLAEVLQDSDLTEIEYKNDACQIRVARQGSVAAASFMPPYPPSTAPSLPHQENPSSSPKEPAVDVSKLPDPFVSPMVGTAYLAPQPDAPPFVTEGTKVTEGDTLLIIEAMKVMNPIRCDRSGIIKKVLVENSAPIEFGQALFIIE